ncbi:MAG: hypothetical protein FJ207_08270 [Gemmatimonadetes bacterium]|nr:hypothetical protein [Gemmatimonadota bacterium]
MVTPAPEHRAALDALIASSSGLQPWRKVLHASVSVAVAALLVVLEPSQAVAVSVLGAFVVAALLVDAIRLTNPGANVLFFRAFGLLVSPREARRIASSTWHVAGILLAVALFPPDVATTAVLVLGLCDPAAALVGRRFGRRPFLGGTVEGTLAFFAVCGLLVGLRHSWPAALAAAAAAGLAERYSWPLDDNLTVPVVCGAAIQAVAWMGLS